MRIALCQSEGAPETSSGIAEVLEASARRAVRDGGDLVLLPELALAGYGDPARNLSLATTRREMADLAGRIAHRHAIAILAGYCEKAPEGLFNSAMLVSSEGRELTNYRKMHLWGEYEKEMFQPGAAAGEVVELGHGLRCGVLICFDLDHPVTAQDLARRGADIILVLSATSYPYEIVPQAQVRARAYENSVFLAFCNQAGTQAGLRFVGQSTVAAPDGSILTRARSDVGDMAFAEIDAARFDAYRRDHRYFEALRNDIFPG